MDRLQVVWYGGMVWIDYWRESEDEFVRAYTYIKLPALLEEGRRRYKLDQHQWTCKNNHVTRLGCFGVTAMLS